MKKQGDKNRRARSRRERRHMASTHRRQLLFEPLEDRRLLVATDFATITGIVFKDATGNGFDPGEQIAGASVQLFRDANGNGQIDAGDGGAIRSAVTNGSGQYRFERLSAGNYLVRQPAQTAGGMQLAEQVSSTVVVSSQAAQGVAGINIDAFTTAQTVMAPFPVGTTANSTILAAEAIGGERDLIGMINAGSDNSDNVDLTSGGGRLAFEASFGATGLYTVVWDGPDGDGLNTDFVGLQGVDLTQNGTATHFEMAVGVEESNAVARLFVYTNQSNWSQVTVPLSQTTGQNLAEYLIDFDTDFSIGGGSGANFSNVGAIVLEIETRTTAADGIMTVIGSRGPTEVTANIDNFSSADLSLTKTADTTTPNVGSNVTFTLTLTNEGPDAATNVAVLDDFPPGLTFVRFNSSQGNYNSGTGLWSVGTVNAGSNATLTLVATANSTTTSINAAQVTASDQFDPDSTPNNNNPSEDDQDSVTVSPQSADLELAMSVNDTAPNLGGTVTYTIEVTNRGVSTATGVEVTNRLPAGLTFNSFLTSQGSYNSSSGVWTVGTIANGATATLQITATINQNGSITNTAQVSRADQTDPDSTPNNSAADEDDQASVTVVAQAANLSLVKTVDKASPNIDENITFTLTVSNAGPDTATGVEVTDRLPTGIAFVSINPPGASYNSSTGLWQVGSIPANSQSSLQITGTVTSIGDKTNVAEITASDQFDPNSTPGNGNTNEDDYASIVISPQTADLRLAKTVNNDRPDVGDTVTFNIAVTNDGPDTATNIVVQDTLGPGLTFVNASQSQGNFNQGNSQWSVGSLSRGVTATLQITARVESIGTKENSAEIIAADQFDPDSTVNNGVLAEDDQDNATVTPSSANLSLTKSVSNATPSINEEFTFTIIVNNAGPDTATNVVVEDVLPPGISFVGANASQGSYNSANGRWNVGSIASGRTASLVITATPVSDEPQTNTAQIFASDQFDPNSTPNNNVANEDDQESVSITPQSADLSLTKGVSDQSPNVGDNITFTLVVANDGPSAADDIRVRDVLPPQVSFVSATESVGSYDDASGIWDVGQLGRATTATLQIVAEIVDSAPFTNRAEIIRSSVFDPDSTPDNNVAGEDDQAAVDVAPRIADLSLMKTVDKTAPNVGDRVTFTVAVTNNGPDAATNVTVRDSLPATASFVSSAATQGTFNRNTGIWTVGSIASGVTVSLELVVMVDNELPQQNVAEIMTANQFDPDSTPGNNVASEDDFDTVSFSPQIADLELSKTVDNSSPNIGDRVTFEVTVFNRGPSDATNIVVQDLLTAGLEFVSANESTGQYNRGTGQWSIPEIRSGRTVTLDLVAEVTEVGEKVNTAEIIAVEQFDPDSTPGNDVATEDDQDSVTLTPQVADLSLIKTVNENRPNVGDNVTFTLTVSNDGPDNATNVVISDPLPAGLQFISATPTRGVYNVSNGQWSVGTVQRSTSASLILVARVVDSGTKTNSAEVLAVDQFDPDSTPGNNVGTEDDQDAAVVTPLAADLTVAKSVDNEMPNVGDTVTFSVGVGNLGPDPASGVVVMDLLPAGLTFVSATASTGTYNETTGVWQVGDVMVDVGASLQIVATVDSVGSKVNKAEVIFSNVFDPNSTPNNGVAGENDQDSVTIVPQQADLSLTKTVNNTRPNVGDNVTFTVTVRNEGPNMATTVTVLDQLPPDLTYVSDTTTIGNYNRETGIWIIGTLGANESATLTITATVAGPNINDNVAQILTSDQADPDSTPNNNIAGEDDQDSAALMPQVVDVSIAKIGSSDPIIAGQELTYTLTVANTGNMDATGVVVTDTLPAGVTFVSASSTVSGATISHQSGIVTANLGRLNGGNSATVTIVVMLGEDTKGILTNTAEVRADQFDANAANNTATLATTAKLPPSSISGVVYIDMNNNGVRDPIETAIGGVTVTLDGIDEDGNRVRRSVITGANGAYFFGDLQPGNYNVIETQPALFGSGQATLGDPNVGQKISNDEFFFALGAGQNVTNNNFGETFPFLTRRDCIASSKAMP